MERVVWKIKRVASRLAILANIAGPLPPLFTRITFLKGTGYIEETILSVSLWRLQVAGRPIAGRSRRAMFRHHKFSSSTRLWRLVRIVRAVFVFSDIAFDVLDPDVSGANLLDHADLRMKPSLLDSSIFKESIRLQHKDKLTALRFLGRST